MISLLSSAFAALSWELGVIALGVTVAMAALVAAYNALAATPRQSVVARIEAGIARSATVGHAAAASRWRRLLARLASPLGAVARPTRAEELSELRAKLVQGGLRSERAMELFLASKLVLAGTVTLTFLNINGRLTGGLRFPLVAAVALIICAVAFFLPNIWLAMRISARQRDLRRALPDAMDLLVTCVEAGLGLDAALSRVADELRLVAPLLSAELTLTFLETQAGMARREAVKRLSDRTGVEDLRQLAAVLTQTEIFGTSVARALRVHGDGMRVQRMLDAERRAAMVGVKMTFPLVLCILPSLVAVVMGPAMVTLFNQMFGPSGLWRD